jgi:plasmid stabilization system protein ParE
LNRFLLSAGAQRDLDDIREYLVGVPPEHAKRIAQSLRAMLRSVGKQPLLGTAHSYLTRLLGEEVRSRIVPPYRIFYRFGKNVPEVIAILHGARDQHAILGERYQ